MRRLVPMVMCVALLAACGDKTVSQPAAAPSAAGATPAPAVVTTPATTTRPATTATPATPQASTAPALPSTTAVTTVAAPGTTATAVPEALAFKAPLVGGGELNLADYAGKPVLLWFWAPT
jgi:hypothetical protein